MNDNNDKWLGEIFSKTINTKKPKFDIEKFKQKFPDVLEILQSKKSEQPQTLISSKRIFDDPISSLATAAVLILTVGLFVYFSKPKENTIPFKAQNVEKSHSELLTSISLMNAYLTGGMEAVDEQNRKAVKMFKPEEITIHKLLSENNDI